MPTLPEPVRETLRELAHAVARHRGQGGTLDGLPPAQQEMLRAMGPAHREVFLEELAAAQAEAGRARFRESLGRWRHARPEPDPDGAH